MITDMLGEHFSVFVKVWYIQKRVLHFKQLCNFTEKEKLCKEHDWILLPHKSRT